MSSKPKANGEKRTGPRLPDMVPDTGRRRFDRAIEIVVAVVLGAVALATAWSGYQSARWGGVRTSLQGQAGALRTEATRASTLAGQQTSIDVLLFGNWINAYAEDNVELVDFYEARFRDEFKPAFDAWIAAEPAQNPDAPPTPFRMPEYTLAAMEEAERLDLEAADLMAEAQAADEQGDAYVLNTVILATVLFLASIVSRFEWPPVRVAVLIAMLVLLSIGLFNLAVYPVA